MPKRKEPTPQMIEFWKWYTSPASPTYSNALQSALKAGYKENYAKSSVHRTVIPYMKKYTRATPAKKEVQNTNDRAQFYTKMLEQAEQNIKEDLKIDPKGDPKLHAIKQKSTLFTAERLGKDTWSARKEVQNAGFAVNNEQALQSLADSLAKLADAQRPAISAQYEVIDGETVENRDEQGT